MTNRNAQQRLIAKIVARENTMIKRNARQRLIAKIVELVNTMTFRDAQQRLIVNLIASPDHTLHLTKLRVSFVRKVSGKIKMDSQVVIVVSLENSIMELAQQFLFALLSSNALTLAAIYPTPIRAHASRWIAHPTTVSFAIVIVEHKLEHSHVRVEIAVKMP